MEVIMRTPSLAFFVAMVLLLITSGVLAQDRAFVAHLSGQEEVPPADTRAQGQAVFRVSSDGLHIQYQVNVANISDITQAHIHLAGAGMNGPVVAWLYPATPPSVLIPGRFQGVLAAGVITEANLVGPLAGQTLADIIAAIQDGETYVNVHTLSYPGGEIRGQIQ
jgi:hypothetical protein